MTEGNDDDPEELAEADPIEVDLEPTRVAGVEPVFLPDLPSGTGLPEMAVPLERPAQLGRYQLVGLIGKGGMAEVFLAKQDGPAGFQKTCVVKRIRRSLSEETRFVDMFLREARVAARLNHPNAVQIFELGKEGKEYFIAMEFLDGVSLHRAARRSWRHGESVPMEVALRATADAALGLHHAHSLTGSDGRPTPLIHRDVSPDNIILTRDGVSKVLDFGIAKSTDIEEQTGTGEVKGKIPFMSPEQLQGLPLDRRSDLWSLGVTLYWLLTGRRPFDGKTEAMTIDGILRRDPVKPRELNPLIPQSVENLLLQLLERDREKRVDSGAVLADKVLALLGPSAGYSPAATFAARAMQWPDADPSQPQSVLTVVAARPESQWLQRLDEEQAESLERLYPESTPSGTRRALAVEPSTGKTVTGLRAEVLDGPNRAVPIAAGVFLAGALAIAAFFVLHGATPAPTSLPPSTTPPTVAATSPATPPDAPPVVAPTPDVPDPTPPPVATPSKPTDHHVSSSSGGTGQSVRAAAPGAVSWKLNGRHLGSGNGTIKVPPGTTKVTAFDNDTGGTVNVNVVDGVADYNAVPTGTVLVRVKPWAEVELGKKKLGQTPIDPLTLKAGHYTFHLVHDALTKNVNVDVKPGGTVTATADMRDD